MSEKGSSSTNVKITNVPSTYSNGGTQTPTYKVPPMPQTAPAKPAPPATPQK